MRSAALLLILATPALADTPPSRCDAAREGALSCAANRICICRFERGGSLTGRPDRFVWDCGILRPDCAPGSAGPALPEAPAGPPPWSDPPPDPR